MGPGGGALPTAALGLLPRAHLGLFFKDTVGIDLLDRIGEDNVLFETDYPHQDGTFPRSKQVAEELFGHLPQPTINKIARGNAIKLLGLDFEP